MILITGANGTIGRSLVVHLRAHGHDVRAAIRPAHHSDFTEGMVVAPDLGPDANWLPALTGVHTIVHTAARVHVMRDEAADPLLEFRHVNVSGTLQLAKQAAACGVRRIVMVSSVKAMGESTEPNRPFQSTDRSSSMLDPYGQSKLEAEAALREVANSYGIEFVIVRSPLVYGPGVKGNFASLLRVVQRGWPLPLGAVTDNRRSFVALDNLVDLLRVCISHPGAANQVLLVSDGYDLSTAELLRRMGQALERPARLVPVPVGLLQVGARCLGRTDMAQRLLGSLQVDISDTCRRLGWTPPVAVDDGLRRAAGKDG